MKVAYLDPPYSRYFHGLAGRLAQGAAADDGDGGGNEVVALLSSPAYRLYTGGDRCIVWTPGRSAMPHALPADHVRTGWLAGDERSRAVFAHAVEWFKRQFADERIDVCLVFSDVRPFSLAAKLAALQLGIVCVYFERGAFRFSTASLSTQGLNSRFSLRRGAAVLPDDDTMAGESLRRRAPEPWLRTRFAAFMARNALACALRPDRGRIQHKRYAIGPYLRLALAQWWTAHHDAAADTRELALVPGRPVVVLPLQLQSDSQLVLHSPFDGNQEFIDFVSARVKAVCPDAELVFKRHPMDTRRYRLPAGGHWYGGNIARLYERAPVVVCVNSTVGFEALIHGVRVICFAPSFYAEAANLAMTTPEGFVACLHQTLKRPGDADTGRALRAEVLRLYQAPGDVWAFTDKDIERTAALVCRHIDGARRAGVPAAVSPAAANDPASASAGAAAAGAADRPAVLPKSSEPAPTALARQW
jgi:capsular polysaccharide export protein